VKFTRLNFFVPVPQVRDLAQLNARLREQCQADQGRRLRGQAGTKAQLMAEDQAAFLPPAGHALWGVPQRVHLCQQPLAGAV
jgi:hypothetical protein